jgi:sugar phosphate isomerase/epimerase
MQVGTIVWVAPGLEPAEPGDHYPNLRAETLDQEIAWARAFGFTGLQVGWRADPTLGPDAIAKACQRNGIEVVALSAYTDLLSPEHNWPCPDLAAVKQMIATAPALGTDTVVTWGGFGDADNAAQRQVVHAALAEAADCAAEHGVKIAIELYDNCVVGTVDQINALACGLGSDAIGVMMDPPNTMAEADLLDLPGYYARLMGAAGKRLFRAHAKDVLFEGGQRSLPGPGQGQQDYVAYIRALAAAGFDGHLIVEHVNRETVGPARDYVAAKIKEALGDR